jgi:chemotaxis protein CheX
MNLTPTIIIYSTEEVFSTSALLNISPGRPYYRKAKPESKSLTGVTRFSGKASGYAAIHMRNEVADIVTHDLLSGEDLVIDKAVVQDTVCELTNIFAGRIKSYLDPPGGSLQLSLPELHEGENFTPPTDPDAKKLTVPFHTDGGDFWVEVQLTH